MRNPRVRLLTEIALAVALAWVLNQPPMRFWTMPQGGELSLVMLPIMIVALRRGLRAGILTGLLTGVAVYFTEPYVVHPIQYLVDFPVAFGLVGLSGLWHASWSRAVARDSLSQAVWTTILPAVFLGAAGRYAAHVVSGAVFFGEYAPEGQPVWFYSALYNLVVPISAVACFAAAALLLPILSRAVDTSSAAPQKG